MFVISAGKELSIVIKSFTVSVDGSRFGISIGVHLDLISVDPVWSSHNADLICLVKVLVSILPKPLSDDQYLMILKIFNDYLNNDVFLEQSIALLNELNLPIEDGFSYQDTVYIKEKIVQWEKLNY